MEERASSSLGSKILATLVLLIAAWFLLKFIIGFVAWLASAVVVVLLVVAVVWALRQF